MFRNLFRKKGKKEIYRFTEGYSPQFHGERLMGMGCLMLILLLVVLFIIFANWKGAWNLDNLVSDNLDYSIGL